MSKKRLTIACFYCSYAKSLIAMALDENKVIDVPDEAADDDEEDVDDDDDDAADGGEEEAEASDEKPKANGAKATNGKKLETIKEGGAADEADSTGGDGESKSEEAAGSSKPPTGVDEVSSSNGNAKAAASSNDDERPSTSNGDATASTSNGVTSGMDVDQVEDDNEEGEGVSGSLQLAWEILEAAAKIFARQGFSGLPYLADVQTELANIEFENGILDAAREDYGKEFVTDLYCTIFTNYYFNLQKKRLRFTPSCPARIVVPSPSCTTRSD